MAEVYYSCKTPFYMPKIDWTCLVAWTEYSSKDTGLEMLRRRSNLPTIFSDYSVTMDYSVTIHSIDYTTATDYYITIHSIIDYTAATDYYYITIHSIIDYTVAMDVNYNAAKLDNNNNNNKNKNKELL